MLNFLERAIILGYCVSGIERMAVVLLKMVLEVTSELQRLTTHRISH